MSSRSTGLYSTIKEIWWENYHFPLIFKEMKRDFTFETQASHIHYCYKYSTYIVAILVLIMKLVRKKYILDERYHKATI